MSRASASGSPAPSGWIFSPWLDFGFFWLPTALALALREFYGPAFESEGLLFFLVVQAAVDRGHVFATIGPLVRRRFERRIGRATIIAGVLAVAAITFALSAYQFELFIALLSVVAILHVMRQQYGWVMISRRRAGETGGRLLDSVEIWNIMLLPVLWWLSPFGPEIKSYFRRLPFPFFVPPQLARAAMVLHCVVHLVYAAGLLARWRRGQAANWPKLSLMAATWFWFFVPLVMVGSRTAFFFSLMVIHGLPYCVYAFRDTSTQTRQPGERSRLLAPLLALGTPLVFAGLLIAAGGVWMQARHTCGFETALCGRAVGALLFTPLLVHYFFDSFIWRKKSWL